MKYPLLKIGSLLILFGLLAAGRAVAAPQTAVVAAPRTLTVLVGGGQDTTQLHAFFPSTIRVRAGDTIHWNLNANEIPGHSVTFLGGDFPGPKAAVASDKPGVFKPAITVPEPGATGNILNPVAVNPTRKAGAPIETYTGKEYVTSGLLTQTTYGPNSPGSEDFSLTFTTPGTYVYFCQFHSEMSGVVQVTDATASDVPEQPQVDAGAQAEMQALLPLADLARKQGEAVRTQPGPNGTTTTFVRVGNFDFGSADLRAQDYDFMPKQVTVKAGDTVVWTASQLHTVTFVARLPAPDPYVLKPQPDGPPLMELNTRVLGPQVPAGTYDPTQDFGSGTLGSIASRGLTWALTFDQPGTYDYFCALHQSLGMKGTVVVVPK